MYNMPYKMRLSINSQPYPSGIKLCYLDALSAISKNKTENKNLYWNWKLPFCVHSL